LRNGALLTPLECREQSLYHSLPPLTTCHLASCAEELELKRGHIEDLEQRLEETTQLVGEKDTIIQELESESSIIVSLTDQLIL